MTVNELALAASFGANVLFSIVIFGVSAGKISATSTIASRVIGRYFWWILLAGVFWGTIAQFGLAQIFLEVIGSQLSHFALYIFIGGSAVNIVYAYLVAVAGRAELQRRANR